MAPLVCSGILQSLREVNWRVAIGNNERLLSLEGLRSLERLGGGLWVSPQLPVPWCICAWMATSAGRRVLI